MQLSIVLALRRMSRRTLLLVASCVALTLAASGALRWIEGRKLKFLGGASPSTVGFYCALPKSVRLVTYEIRGGPGFLDRARNELMEKGYLPGGNTSLDRDTFLKRDGSAIVLSAGRESRKGRWFEPGWYTVAVHEEERPPLLARILSPFF